MKRPKYSRTSEVEFVKTLKTRVAAYFDDKKISRNANGAMILKTVVMLLMYFGPLALIISGFVAHPLLLLGLWVTMAFGMVGIGMSVMHDANHGSYSKNPKVNAALGYLLNMAGGGSTKVWKIQHNVLHHSFTNIEGHDGDIDTGGLLRLSPNTKRLGIHRLQFLYAWFLYGLTTINWSTFKDYLQMAKYRKRGLTVKSKKQFTIQITRMTLAKLAYYCIFLVLPMTFSAAPWWLTLLFFFAMHFVAGMISSTVFQAAHVVPETDYPNPAEDGNIKHNWFIHQFKTTCNFSSNSRIFSWYVGGLNYQIEHHLFPNISHIHYRKLSEIVQKTAKEFNVPYHEHSTFASVMWAHAKHLWRLGKPDAIQAV